MNEFVEIVSIIERQIQFRTVSCGQDLSNSLEFDEIMAYRIFYEKSDLPEEQGQLSERYGGS